MNLCKNCGVELESSMTQCPLCGQKVSDQNAQENVDHKPFFPTQKLSKKEKIIVWDVFAVIFLAASLVPLIINLIVNRSFSWSQYPIALCLSAFTYITLFAFWKKGFAIKLLGCFITSAVLFLLLDCFIQGVGWPVKVAIPILFIGNLFALILYQIIVQTRNIGINIIAFFFLGCGLLCLAIEATISLYKSDKISLQWSPIAAASAILIFILLIFLHYKLKWGRNLKRTFHL